MSKIILIVEDNEENLAMLVRRMTRRGYEVYRATNGSEGLEIARAIPRPDVILMDLNMPVMDGWECTRQLKADPDTRDIPVIAVSAEIDYREKQKLDETGFYSYCLKPVDFDKLVRLTVSAIRETDQDALSSGG